jgi:hypothetical protein
MFRNFIYKLFGKPLNDWFVKTLLFWFFVFSWYLTVLSIPIVTTISLVSGDLEFIKDPAFWVVIPIWIIEVPIYLWLLRKVFKWLNVVFH